MKLHFSDAMRIPVLIKKLKELHEIYILKINII
jgi:hypothetical protein